MRTICPRCGVTSKDEAEFCVSCGQPLKSAVSSIPPSKVGTVRTPVSEVNVHNVVEDNSSSTHPQGNVRGGEVSVRYRTISTNPQPPDEMTQAPVENSGSPTDNFRETILLHAPTARPVEKAAETKKQSVAAETPKVRTATSTSPPLTERQDAPLNSLQTVETTTSIVRKVVKRTAEFKNTGEVPSLQIQHIWYKMTANSDWNTIALVPASDELETMQIAHGLGAMAVREPCEFVRVVNAAVGTSPSATSNGKIKNKKDKKAGSNSDRRRNNYPYEFFDLVQQLQPDADSASVTQLTKELLNQFDRARKSGTLRDGKIFVSIDSVTSHPDAIALCRAVDKLIICVGLGKTKFGAVKEIVQTVGKDKILGCVAIGSH